MITAVREDTDGGVATEGSPVPRETVDDLLGRAREGLSRLSPVQAHHGWAQGAATMIDVRTSENRQRDGHLPDAIEVSLNVLEWRLDPSSPSRHPRAPGLGDLVVVMCEQGYSSSLAAARLHQLGFSRATDVIGGFEAWASSGLPVVDAVDAANPSPGRVDGRDVRHGDGDPPVGRSATSARPRERTIS